MSKRTTVLVCSMLRIKKIGVLFIHSHAYEIQYNRPKKKKKISRALVQVCNIYTRLFF